MQSKHRRTYMFNFLMENPSNRAMADMCISVLRAANEFSHGGIHYDWSFHTGVKTLTSNPKNNFRHTLILLGDIHSKWIVPQDQRSRLLHHMQQSHRVILVAGAVFIPKQLKIFYQHSLAVHPNFIATATEEGLSITHSHSPFSHMGKAKSAISSIAALSLLIEIISEDFGTHAGIKVSEYIGLMRPMNDYLSKNNWKYLKQARGDKLISSCLKMMNENIEHPLKLSEIAKKLSVSKRQMERQFKKKVNQSPLNVYKNLRLEYANQLILYTDMPIREVGLASGFSGTTIFSRWYMWKYEISASEARASAYEGSSKTKSLMNNDFSYHYQRCSI